MTSIQQLVISCTFDQVRKYFKTLISLLTQRMLVAKKIELLVLHYLNQDLLSRCTLLYKQRALFFVNWHMHLDQYACYIVLYYKTPQHWFTGAFKDTCKIFHRVRITSDECQRCMRAATHGRLRVLDVTLHKQCPRKTSHGEGIYDYEAVPGPNSAFLKFEYEMV